MRVESNAEVQSRQRPKPESNKSQRAEEQRAQEQAEQARREAQANAQGGSSRGVA